jgi:hypothetical protein
MRRRPGPIAALLLLAAALLAACGEAPTTQVLQIATPLPAREEASYRLEDRNGATIGRAVLGIATEGDTYRLTQSYDFGERQQDRSVVLVERASLRPRSSERTVVDGDETWLTRAEYEPARVTVTLKTVRGERRRDAEISESSYDNLESLFLWRTLAMGAGERASYINVVIDPRRGTINRALGVVQVGGREIVNLPGGAVEAWRVDFTSAGVTNTAWYAVSDDRRLLKYAITRGPTLVLESVSR